MVLNATYNNISVISWQSVLLVEEYGVPGENHRPVVSHGQTLSHNVVSSTPRKKRNCSAFHCYGLIFNNKHNSYPKMSANRPLDCIWSVLVTSVEKHYIWPSSSFWCYQFIIFVEIRHTFFLWFFLCPYDILPYMDVWTEWRNEWRIRKLTESSKNRLAAAELSINVLADVMYFNT